MDRFGSWQFPENGVFIIKAGKRTGDGRSISWGDTCRVTPRGTVRMGKAPLTMVIAR